MVRPLYSVEVTETESAKFETEISEEDVHGNWKLKGESLHQSAVSLPKLLRATVFMRKQLKMSQNFFRTLRSRRKGPNTCWFSTTSAWTWLELLTSQQPTPNPMLSSGSKVSPHHLLTVQWRRTSNNNITITYNCPYHSFQWTPGSIWTKPLGSLVLVKDEK